MLASCKQHISNRLDVRRRLTVAEEASYWFTDHCILVNVGEMYRVGSFVLVCAVLWHTLMCLISSNLMFILCICPLMRFMQENVQIINTFASHWSRESGMLTLWFEAVWCTLSCSVMANRNYVNAHSWQELHCLRLPCSSSNTAGCLHSASVELKYHRHSKMLFTWGKKGQTRTILTCIHPNKQKTSALWLEDSLQFS